MYTHHMAHQKKSKLTDRQEKIWSFIKDYRKKHEFGPSWEEIAEEFGINPGSVCWDVAQMCVKGRAKRLYNPAGTAIPRSIEAI
jgi:SOS-response transcriptional repressor LexA